MGHPVGWAPPSCGPLFFLRKDGGATTWQRAIPTTFSTSLGFEGRKRGPRGLMKVAPMHSSSWTQLVRPPIYGPAKRHEFVGCPWNGTILKGKFHPEPSSINFFRGCSIFVRFQGGIGILYLFQTHETSKRESGGNLFFKMETDALGLFQKFRIRPSNKKSPTKRWILGPLKLETHWYALLKLSPAGFTRWRFS